MDTLLEISADGRRLTFVWDDAIAPDLVDEAGGQARVRRASHVEPTAAGRWTADLSPSGGPTLGPYRTRGAALAAERAWLEEHLFGKDG